MKHFEEMFTSISPSTVDLDVELDGVDYKLSRGINEMLCHLFTEDEMYDALFSMRPTKDLGPDNFHVLFFQKKKKKSW